MVVVLLFCYQQLKAQTDTTKVIQADTAVQIKAEPNPSEAEAGAKEKKQTGKEKTSSYFIPASILTN